MLMNRDEPGEKYTPNGPSKTSLSTARNFSSRRVYNCAAETLSPIMISTCRDARQNCRAYGKERENDSAEKPRPVSALRCFPRQLALSFARLVDTVKSRSPRDEQLSGAEMTSLTSPDTFFSRRAVPRAFFTPMSDYGIIE